MYYHIFDFIFLEASFLNALLKYDSEGDLTLFRLLLPFAIVLYAFRDLKGFVSFSGLVSVFFVFQIISISLSNYPVSYLQIAFWGNYLTMFFMFFYIWDIINRIPNELYKFMSMQYFVTVISLVIQYYTGYVLPNINDPDGALNGWYWNENDASLALVAFVILSVRLNRFEYFWLLHVLTLLICIYNDARVAVFSVITSVVYYIWTTENEFVYISITVVRLFIIMLVVTSMLLDYLWGSVLVDAFGNIINITHRIFFLEDDKYVVGSMDVRLNIFIFSLKEFYSSYFLGIGAGNSIAMLAYEKYFVMGMVKSIHNMPMQFFLELGILFVSYLVYAMYTSSKISGLYFLFYILFFMLTSIGQSGGFIANFFAMICFYMVFLYPDIPKKSNVYRNYALTNTIIEK